MQSSTVSPPSPTNVPSGSIAAMVRALPNDQPSAAFRDSAIAILRLSRTRGRAECDALGDLFEDADINSDRRVLILDLLGSAGTPAAQIVMRRLLALAIARKCSRTFATFVSRLGFVERPDVPTLRFLMSVYAESRYETDEVRGACAYTLGAAIGRAHVWGLVDPAMHAAEVLRQDLLSTTSINQKCSLVTALGNAGLDVDVALIVRFVADADTRVRSTAVLALRKMHTVAARSVLLSILGGSDLSLAESALSALFGQSLIQPELVRLAELVLSGRTAVLLDSRILRLIVTQKLSHMEAVASQSPAIEDAIHLLLSRVEDQAARAAAAISAVDHTAVVDDYAYAHDHDDEDDDIVTESGAFLKMDAVLAAQVIAAAVPVAHRPRVLAQGMNLDLRLNQITSITPPPQKATPPRHLSASEALRFCIKKSSRPPAPIAMTTNAIPPPPMAENTNATKPIVRRDSAYAIAQPIVPLLRLG